MMKRAVKNIHYILFLIISVIAVNFNYVEGDDASMVMYHALGRNQEIQPVYSLYHSMFDCLIGLLPVNELFLRYFSIGISFLSNFLVFTLFIKLLKLKEVQSIFFFCLLPFVLPEMFFGGLYVNPTMVSFVMILGSHILLLEYFNSKNKKILWMSILALGFGTSIRWSNGLYLFVLFGEFIMYLVNKKAVDELKSKLLLLIGVFLLYIVSVLLFIYISGYSLFDIFNIYKQGSSYIENKEISYLSYVANATTFLTPAFVFLLFVGGFNIIKEKKWSLLILMYFGLLPFFIIGFYPSYKYMITALPVLIFVISFGYNKLIKQYQKGIVVALIVLPCFLGVKVFANSSFGPGYTIKNKMISSTQDNLSYNPDHHIKIDKVRIGFYGGLAMPTPEGPRPLGGYLWVLLHGWNDIVNCINVQRTNAVNYAIEHNAVILQDVNHSFISTKLLELGYITSDPFYNNYGDYSLRKYTKEDKKILVVVPNDKNKLFDEHFFNNLKLSEEIVVYSSYTNIINKMNKTPCFNSKNAYWGVIKFK